MIRLSRLLLAILLYNAAVLLLHTGCSRAEEGAEMDHSPPKPKALGEIVRLDAGDSPTAQVYRIYLKLDVRSEGQLRRLELRDRYLWLVVRFREEVLNGGVDQFLFNSSGDYAAETREALAAIGATRSHRLLTEACALFPGGHPSKDSRMRADQVREINVQYKRQHIDDVIGGDLDSNLEALLLEYWRLHTPPS